MRDGHRLSGPGLSTTLLVSTLLIAQPACSSGAGSSSSRTPSASATHGVSVTTPTAPTTPSWSLLRGSRVVRFRALDGVRLEGRLFGHGDVGLVLSHMGRPGDNQTDWDPLASFLSQYGYSVLTYNRCGVCPGGDDGCSRGFDEFRNAWMDVIGAVRFLKHEGVDTVFLGGASIGAMATFYAVEQPGVEVAGVIWVAGVDLGSGYAFERTDVSRVTIPKLFISANEDPYGGEASARRLYR